MGRLCERPGCSDPASVAYGMRAEDLVFWLDVLHDEYSLDGGVLCQRHADSMVVPRNWTLDDLRDPDLHLFRPPSSDGSVRRRTRRGQPSSGNTAEQLELGVADEPAAPDAALSDTATVDDDDTATVDVDGAAVPDPAISDIAVDDEEAATAAPIESWSPSFDEADDLGGLLSARSPLLSRAFRGDDRPRT